MEDARTLVVAIYVPSIKLVNAPTSKQAEDLRPMIWRITCIRALGLSCSRPVVTSHMKVR